MDRVNITIHPGMSLLQAADAFCTLLRTLGAEVCQVVENGQLTVIVGLDKVHWPPLSLTDNRSE